MIKIIIADDHQIVIDGIKLMFSTEDDLTCVAEANNGQEVLDVLKEVEADVLVLDIDMPILNGIETSKQLQQSHPDLKIVALSMLSEVSLIKMILKYGAKGFLLKNAGKDEVLEAIRTIHRGKKYFSADVSEIVMNSFSKNNTSTKTKTNPFPKLSRREKQVLALIVDEFTTSEIAEKLFIGFGTVETHRRNLLMKLGARNTAGLVRACLEYDLLNN